ncbi:hypothetical protein [Nocardioides sp.]|uniref:hypothetical protein n=1 Tax=Nocardioides sp. TaxID=35761 RepID=UPI0039E45F63
MHGGTSQDPVADIVGATWTGCTFIGVSVSVVVTSPNWHLHAVSGYTTAATDTVVGTIDNIAGIVVTIANCKFTVTGYVGGNFLEDNGKSGQEFAVTSSNLTIATVNSAILCAGLVDVDDAATFTGAYNLDSTAAGYINLQP